MDVNGGNAGQNAIRSIMPAEPAVAPVASQAPVAAPAPVQAPAPAAIPANPAPVAGQQPTPAPQGQPNQQVPAPAAPNQPPSSVIVAEMRRRGFDFGSDATDDGFVTQVEQVWNENQTLRDQLDQLNRQANAATPGPAQPGTPAAQQLPPVPETPLAAAASSTKEEDPFAQFRVQPLSNEAQSIAHLLKQDGKGFYYAEDPQAAANLGPYIKEINDWAMKQNAVQKMLLQDPLGMIEKLSGPLVSKATKAMQDEIAALKSELTKSQSASELERVNQEIRSNHSLYFQTDPTTGQQGLTAFGQEYERYDAELREMLALSNHTLPEAEIHKRAVQAARRFLPPTPQAPAPQQQAPVPPPAAPQAAAPVASPRQNFLQRVAGNPASVANPAPPQEYAAAPPHRSPQDRFVARASAVREFLTGVNGYHGG